MINAERNRKYQRDWYHKNRKKKRIQVRQRAIRIRAWIKAQKVGKKCSSCPESDPVCLDFHHLNQGEKTIEISLIYSKKGWGIKRIQEEIDKCTLLCANCHRKVHKFSCQRSPNGETSVLETA